MSGPQLNWFGLLFLTKLSFKNSLHIIRSAPIGRQELACEHSGASGSKREKLVRPKTKLKECKVHPHSFPLGHELIDWQSIVGFQMTIAMKKRGEKVQKACYVQPRNTPALFFSLLHVFFFTDQQQ